MTEFTLHLMRGSGGICRNIAVIMCFHVYNTYEQDIKGDFWVPVSGAEKFLEASG